jgi:hypothetical protein
MVDSTCADDGEPSEQGWELFLISTPNGWRAWSLCRMSPWPQLRCGDSLVTLAPEERVDKVAHIPDVERWVIELTARQRAVPIATGRPRSTSEVSKIEQSRSIARDVCWVKSQWRARRSNSRGHNSPVGAVSAGIRPVRFAFGGLRLDLCQDHRGRAQPPGLRRPFEFDRGTAPAFRALSAGGVTSRGG